MTTKNMVDNELRPLLDIFPAINYSLENLLEVRAQVKSLATMAPPIPTTANIFEHHIQRSSDETSVRVVVYSPPLEEKNRPALLHIHGGGYVVGQPEFSDARLRKMIDQLGCVIISVDYKLAPENQHPEPIEDCYTSLQWLYHHSAELGIDPDKIAIAGESAGGGLCAALALLARDRHEIPIIFQCLIYPMLDDRTCVQDPNPYTGEFIWTRESNIFGWTSLLGHAPGGENVSCYAAAARATDLRNLPPAFIAVGSLDLFLDENINYAKRLLQAGVTTELHVYPGAYHGFDMVTESRVTKQFETNFLEALKKAWS